MKTTHKCSRGRLCSHKLFYSIRQNTFTSFCMINMHAIYYPSRECGLSDCACRNSCLRHFLAPVSWAGSWISMCKHLNTAAAPPLSQFNLNILTGPQFGQGLSVALFDATAGLTCTSVNTLLTSGHIVLGDAQELKSRYQASKLDNMCTACPCLSFLLI